MPECAWQADSRHSRSTSATSSAPGAQLALEHPHLVGDQALDRPLHVEHLGAAAVPGEHAGVGDLAAGLGVERRRVEDDAGDLAGARPRPVAPSSARSETSASTRESVRSVVVGAPVGRAVLGQQPPVGADVDRAGALGAGVGAGAVALLLHERAEALLVDGHALLGGHLEGDVDREAVGVVQLERLLADSAGVPARLAWATAVSNSAVPEVRVRRNASSSA